jgi:hypothetical protein
MSSHSESLIRRLSHFFEGAFQTFARRGLAFLKDDSTSSPGTSKRPGARMTAEWKDAE